MNSRTVLVSVAKVVKALVAGAVFINSGDLDAKGREVKKNFPELSKAAVLSNLDSRIVRVPNRWTFILPEKKAILAAVRRQRDWAISEHKRESISRVRDANGKFSSVSEFEKEVKLYDDLLQMS